MNDENNCSVECNVKNRKTITLLVRNKIPES